MGPTLNIEIIKIIFTFLSGGVAGSILTFVLNEWIRKRNREVLTIIPNYRKYSPNLTGHEEANFEKMVRTTCDSEEYANLHHYRIKLQNNCRKSIENYKIIIFFPKNTKIVEKTISAYPEINKEYKINPTKKNIEYHLDLDRMEVNDEILLHFKVDSSEIEKIWIKTIGLKNVPIYRKCQEMPFDLNKEYTIRQKKRINISKKIKIENNG